MMPCGFPRAATLAILAVVLGLCSPSSAGGEALSDDLRRFIEDEVRYIITDQERAEWGSLETNAERLEFAKAFWAKRDPDPSTPRNEFREEHHQRILAANQLFRGEGKPGWLTDRGRIYIIFGPPDEILEDAYGAVQEGPSALTDQGGLVTPRTTTRGRITFTYRAPQNPYLGPNTKIVFEATPAGRYDLASDVNWSPEAAYFSSTLGRTTRDDEIQKPKTEEDIKTEPLGMKQADIFAQLHEGERPPEVAELPMEVSFFPVGQPQIYVPVRFERTWTTPGPTETLRVRARADREGDPPIHIFDLTLTPEGPDTRSLGFMLDPGRYWLGLACEDANGRVVAASLELVEVPDLGSGKLATSSVLLVRSVQTRQSGTVDMLTLQDGLMLGNFALEAALGNSVPHGSPDPYLIYLVSGAAAKPTGELDLVLRYAIKRDGELVKEFNERPQKRAFVGHPLPVTDLQPSDYSLEMTLTDRVADQKLEQTVAFRVE